VAEISQVFLHIYLGGVTADVQPQVIPASI